MTAGNEISFTDMLRAIDDSDLTPYEMRYVIRVWRRGACWETVKTTRETTGMSAGQISKVRNSLLEKGWLIRVVAAGKFAFRVAIPDVAIVHTVNDVHAMNGNVHTVNENVHVVRTLPLIEQQEVNPIKYDGAHTNGAPESGGEGEEARATRQAIAAILELTEFWQDLTRRRRPPDEGIFRETWFKPFNDIWIACGRDVDAAKAKVQAVRNDMLAQGLTIFDPGKLAGHVQTMIDRELLPLTQRMNGKQPAQAPVVMKEIAPGLY